MIYRHTDDIDLSKAYNRAEADDKLLPAVNLTIRDLEKRTALDANFRSVCASQLPDDPSSAYSRSHTPGRSVHTTLFCEIDDAYQILNPQGELYYASLKKLSDSEVITLAIFQQLRGVESERCSFLREVARFFSHLFPKMVGLHPSSFHRRLRKLRRFLEPLRRTLLLEQLVGDPETIIVDSTLLEVLHPRQVPQSAGFDGAASSWVRWGSFSVYGVKLHMLCATNRVPISYELTAASTADVHLTKELLEEAKQLGEEVARRLLADLAYRSEDLEEELARLGISFRLWFRSGESCPHCDVISLR